VTVVPGIMIPDALASRPSMSWESLLAGDWLASNHEAR
jgi:hypothetical protein